MPPATTRHINLQVTRTDWLILNFTVTTDRVDLTQILRVRWTPGTQPRLIDNEHTHPPARHREQKHAIDSLTSRWNRHTDTAAVDTARRLARKLLRRGFYTVIAGDHDNVDVDVAIAAPDETSHDILTRMHGRCLQDSVIARPNRRLGITYFSLARTAARDARLDLRREVTKMGKPSTGTPKDGRLKQNKSGTKKSSTKKSGSK